MAGAKIPREPHRYSGRTAMLANISVHEPKPPDDPDSPLSFSMEGTPGPAALCADPVLLVAGLELDSGGEQVSGGDRRSAARRRSGRAADRAGDGAGFSFFEQPPPPFEAARRRVAGGSDAITSSAPRN